MKIKLPMGVILFALLWSFAAVLPPVRDSVRAILAINNPAGESARALQSKSSNPIAIVWVLQYKLSFLSANKTAIWNQWDALIDRSPDQLWIAAARVNAASNYNLIPAFKTNSSRPPQISEKDRAQLEKVVRIAAESSEQEPKNAFWPLMEAAFCFALGQKERALQAVDRAGQATYFNDYAQSISLSRLRWWIKRDNPSWEERSSISYLQLYPQISAFRIVNEMSSLEAARLRHNGDNKPAIHVVSRLLDADKLWRNDSKAFIGVLVADSSARTALGNFFDVKPPGGATYEELQTYASNLQQRWIAFCRANGRNDLQSRADWLTHKNDYMARRGYMDDYLWMQNGLKAPWGIVAAFVPYGLTGLATWCFFQAIAWLYGSLLLGKVPQTDGPTRGQIATCANFGFWSLGTTWLAASCYQKGFLLSSLTTTYWQWNETPFPLWSLIDTVLVVALASWLIPVFFLGWKRDRRFRWVRSEKEARALPGKFGRARVLSWLLFFVFTAVVASNGRGLWDDTLLQLPISASIALISLCVATTLEVIRFKRSGRGWPQLRLEGEVPENTVPRSLKWARVGTWLVAAASFYAAFLGGKADWPPLFSSIGLPLGVVAVVVALGLGRKINSGDRFTFRLATQSAGVLSIIWSIMFLLLAIGSWPLRVELNHQLERRFTMKEVDWMQEQTAKN